MLCKKMNGNKVESYILTKIKVQKKVNLSDMTHLFDHVLNDFSKIKYLTKLAFDSFLMKMKKVIRLQHQAMPSKTNFSISTFLVKVIKVKHPT